jgi:hypothetical protein
MSGESPQTTTLAAGVVKTITFSVNYGIVEVLNATGTSAIYFRTDGVDPTVGGDGCEVVPAAIGSLKVADRGAGAPTEVRIISAGTPQVSVRGE